MKSVITYCEIRLNFQPLRSFAFDCISSGLYMMAQPWRGAVDFFVKCVCCRHVSNMLGWEKLRMSCLTPVSDRFLYLGTLCTRFFDMLLVNHPVGLQYCSCAGLSNRSTTVTNTPKHYRCQRLLCFTSEHARTHARTQSLDSHVEYLSHVLLIAFDLLWFISSKEHTNYRVGQMTQ